MISINPNFDKERPEKPLQPAEEIVKINVDLPVHLELIVRRFRHGKSYDPLPADVFGRGIQKIIHLLKRRQTLYTKLDNSAAAKKDEESIFRLNKIFQSLQPSTLLEVDENFLEEIKSSF